MLVGVLLRLDSRVFASIIPIWVSLLLPLPAVVDFTAHELEWWRSNNPKRLLSGLLLGLAVGIGGYALVRGPALWGAFLIAWLVILEFGVAVALQCAGRLDGYIERYERGVRQESEI